MMPERLGPYLIQRKLGSGGMGDVFAGIHDQSREPAAIKVLPSHLGKQAGFRSRFEVEIETLRRLDHPHIVRILGFGEQDGVLFYAMELVDGQSLENRIEGGKRLPWRQVVDIAQQLCRALKHAHDRGIIHRDLKPANVMMIEGGQVKLADFGIAQLYGVSGLTIEGGIVGTASYLSPEQADGEKVSARSDLYSLGATLYALLTGRPPFVGKTLPELLKLQRTAPATPPSLLVPDVPVELDAVILGLLAKSPQDRIGAAMMLARSLQAVQDAAELRLAASQPAQPTAPSPREKSRASDPDATLAGGADETIINPSTAKPATAADATGVSGATMDSSSPASSNTPATPDDATQPGTVAYDEVTLASRPAASAKPSPLSPAQLPPVAKPTVKVSQPAAAQPGVPSGSGSNVPASSLSGSTGGVFMTAQEAAEADRRRQEALEVPQPREIPVGLILLIVGAILLAIGIWVVLKPPTADALYDRIIMADRSGESQQLMAAGEAIDEFRQLYPEDPRQSQIAPIEARLNQLRAGRLRPIVQRHFDTGQDDLPLAQLRDQAMILSTTDPVTAAAQLQAILTLAGDGEHPEEDQAILDDIRQRLAQLQASAAQSTTGHLLLIRQRLNHARELQSTDPAQARAIAGAVVQLYAEKTWAAEAVSQARAMLAE